VAEEEPHELVIIRHHGGHEEDHHGGAWKIAFADFMTAMMALFLVLWLINSTDQKVRSGVAQYFNPMKLAEMSTLKKGLRDPTHTEAVTPEDDLAPDSESKDNKKNPYSAKSENVIATRLKKTPRTEAALFRDPYAVLTEIAGPADKPLAPQLEGSGRFPQAPVGLDPGETYRDPFATIARQQEMPTKIDLGQEQSNPREDAALLAVPATPSPPLGTASAGSPQQTPDKLKANGAKNQQQTLEKPAEAAAKSQSNAEAEAAKLRAEISDALNKEAASNGLPKLDVQSTTEGILISLTDENNFSMFGIGSAEPQKRTVQVLEKIAQLLQRRPGTIVLRGYTDARPYKTSSYDNWRLSSARAHMAYYMLSRGGLDEKRIERIEGYADHRLKLPLSPEAPENRRIEILLREEKL
jgi:chemotaxis protein MotB